MPEWPSPVGMLIRGPDKFAKQGGVYHAARSTEGRSREHEGIDILTIPRSPIQAPFTASVIRTADPYDDKHDAELLGILIRHMGDPRIQMKILYCKPVAGIIGKTITKGTIIAHAQTLQHLYPGIQDHVHVEVSISGMRVDPTPFFFDLTQPPLMATT